MKEPLAALPRKRVRERSTHRAVCLDAMIILLSVTGWPHTVSAERAGRVDRPKTQALQQVAQYELADGTKQRLLIARTGKSAALVHRELAEARHGTLFVQTRAGAWHITSYWQHDALVTVQVRDVADGAELLQSRHTPPVHTPSSAHRRAPGSRGAIPAWWPELIDPWVRVSKDAHWRTTTLLGWVGGSLDIARAQIGRAAKRAGLRRSMRAPGAQAEKQGGNQVAGELLVYSSARGPATARAELVVTLMPEPMRTGVVAHWREAMQ